LKADVEALSGPKTALSVCEPTRLRKLDMVRLKFEVEPKVERLEGGAPVESSLAERVEGVGVDGGAPLGVWSGLLGGCGGGVAAVLTTRGGLELSAVVC
jgi:hypothetical protein